MRLRPWARIRRRRQRQRRRTALWLCACSWLLLPAGVAAQSAAPDSTTIFQRAFGQRQQPKVQRLVLPVSVDGKELGLVSAEIKGAQVELQRKSLAELLKPLLQAQLLERLRAPEAPPRITLEDLVQLGLEPNYSADRVTLDIGVPLALRPVQTLSLGSRAQDSGADAGLKILPQAWSWISNLRWNLSLQDSGQDKSQSQRLFVDSAGRWHEWVIESSATVGGIHSPSSASLQSLRLSRDWAPEALRLSLGDVTAMGQGGSSTQTLMGVGLARLFGLNPELATQSLPTATLALPRGATVDVSVNGLPSSTLRLPPGVYRLNDLPVFAGANAVDLMITEPNGQVSHRSFDYFFSSSLLRQGVNEYDLALGYPMTSGGNGRQYDSGQRVLTGWWRRGWSESLSAGISLQARSGSSGSARLAGLDAVVATRLGDFAGWLARSQHRQFGGQAGSLQWRWNSTLQQQATYSVAALAQLSRQSEGYAPIGSELPGPARHDVGLRLSLLWSDGWRGSAGMLRRYNDSTGDDSRDRSLSLRRRINRQWSAELTLGWRRLNQEQDRNIAFLLTHTGVADSSGADRDLLWQNSASIQSEDRRLQWDGLASGSGSWLGSEAIWQLGAGLADARSGQDRTLQWRAQHGRAEGSVFLSEHVSGMGTTRVLDTTVGAAVLGSGEGGWNWSAPVLDSAAQFKPYRGYEGLKLLIDPQADRAVLTSDRFGMPPLANLGAYVPRPLQLDFEDLPSGRSMGMDRPVLLPTYRSVLVVPVGSNALTRIQGRLIGKDGQPLGLQSLLLRNTQGQTIDLFTNRSGQFTSPQLSPGRYILQRPEENTVLASFVVNDDDQARLDIGILQIEGDSP